jgi:hypothetical protein
MLTRMASDYLDKLDLVAAEKLIERPGPNIALSYPAEAVNHLQGKPGRCRSEGVVARHCGRRSSFPLPQAQGWGFFYWPGANR